jgi:hypothetical protein
MIYTIDGKEHSVQLDRNEADETVANIAKSAPWAMAGFQGHRALRWNAHKQKLIAEIEQKTRSTST